MSPPFKLNYSPAPTYTETFHVVNSCAPIAPVCSAPEPMVVEDEAHQMCVVTVAQRCTETFHRIPGLNLFRQGTELRRAHRQTPRSNQAQSAEASPPQTAPHASDRAAGSSQ